MHPWAQARDKACTLAKTDTDAALAVARGMADGWYRAQALAWIGFFSKSARFRAILEEAKSASWSATDPYRIVGSSAWWMRAWVERGEPHTATDELEPLLAQANLIEHPVSRLEALTTLLGGVFPAKELRDRALEAQIKAATLARSWRSGDRLRNSAIMLAWTGDSEASARVVAVLPEGRYRRQALRGVAEAKPFNPRPFFW